MELIDVFIFVLARMSRQKYSISKYESDLSDLGPRRRLGPRQRGLYLILKDKQTFLFNRKQCALLFLLLLWIFKKRHRRSHDEHTTCFSSHILRKYQTSLYLNAF